jgi:hypothetical protein
MHQRPLEAVREHRPYADQHEPRSAIAVALSSSKAWLLTAAVTAPTAIRGFGRGLTPAGILPRDSTAAARSYDGAMSANRRRMALAR